MAVERLDPHQQPCGDPIVVEHYARYVFASQFVFGKRVLDVACGTGYGSQWLLKAGAAAVTGADISVEAIAACRERYPEPGLEFVVADAQTLAMVVRGPFDVIVSFETLEHLHDPGRLLAECVKLSHPATVCVVSVPNDTELQSENPFHVASFDRARLTDLLAEHFDHVEVLSQSLALSSTIQADTGAASPIHTRPTELADIDQQDSLPECLVAVCSAHTPVRSVSHSARSRSFWNYYLELERANGWLHRQVTEWQAAAGRFERMASEQQARTAQLEASHAWLSEQRSTYERAVLDQSTVIAQQRDWIVSLEDAKTWLAEQRAVWEATAHDQEDVIAEQRRWIADLERAAHA